MAASENLNQYKDAYRDDFKFNDENMAMLSAYARHLINYAATLSDVKILGLGIGHRMVSQTVFALLGNVSKFTIVEGSDEIIETYKAQTQVPTYVNIVNDYFENFDTTERYDILEMGFVLEHVDDPELIVTRFKKFLKPNGRIFMAVPNALGLHRRIGHAAGLLNAPYALSAEDLMLGHKRYYDYTSFTKLALHCGLRIVSTKGILLKPVTTSQMQMLNLPENVYNALFKVAEVYPELANAILIEATV